MWDSVLGHQQNKEFLMRYLKAGERPHALLFCGGEGLGKRQLALHFAKTLLCFNQNGADKCESCRLLNFDDGNLSHPDFIFLEPEEGAKNIKIEQIKELINQSAFGPTMSQNKVCIVDKADTMTTEAANSFLKLLEEPPEGWVIIMLAASENKLLPTILSRVVKLRFSPVAVRDVKQVLSAQGINASEASVLARISEGSIGMALTLDQQGVFDSRQQAVAFLEALPLNAPVNYLANRSWIDKPDKDKAFLLVKNLQLLLRDMLFLKINLPDELYNCDLKDNLALLAKGWNYSSLKSALSEVNLAYEALASSVSPKLALEAMALKIDKFRKE